MARISIVCSLSSLAMSACSSNNPVNSIGGNVQVSIAAVSEGFTVRSLDAAVQFRSENGVFEDLECRPTAADPCEAEFFDAGEGGVFEMEVQTDPGREILGWSGDCTPSADQRRCRFSFSEADLANAGGPLQLEAQIDVTLTPGSNLLVNQGFEEEDYRTGLVPIVPARTAFWQGDVAQVVEGAQADGIAPQAGSRMLRCDASGPFTGDSTFVSCEVFQLVDVRAFGAEIDAGEVQVSASVQANRVDLDPETDTDFLLRVFALRGPPGEAPDEWSAPLERFDSRYTSDADVATWEGFGVTDETLPTGTRTLMVLIAAVENVSDDGGAEEFDGHYMDNASLSISLQ